MKQFRVYTDDLLGGKRIIHKEDFLYGVFQFACTPDVNIEEYYVEDLENDIDEISLVDIVKAFNDNEKPQDLTFF